MQRVPRRRLLAAILASLTLMAVAIPPIAGVASAASTSTTCPSSEGSECFLGISTPESVLTGVPFTVTVGVYTDSDRTVLAKSDPCGSKVLITLDVDPSGSLTFNSSQTVSASAAVATFNVTIPAGNTNDGLYFLFAHVGSSDLAPASTTSCDSYFYDPDEANVTAITIPATQPIAPCPDNVTCKQVTSGSGSAATLIADTGTFPTAVFGALVSGEGCESVAPFGPADPNGVLTFDYLGGDPKTIVLALSAELVTKGIAQFNICWASINPFTQLGGTPAPLVGGLYTGYLPACKKGDAGPCILFKKSNQYNVAFFGILAPPSDPKTYPK